MHTKMKRFLFDLTAILVILGLLAVPSAAVLADSAPRPEEAEPFDATASGGDGGATTTAATILALTGVDPFQAGADRLASLQNNDGGWDWPLDDGNPANASPQNTIGPIGKGLAEAYLHTGNPDHLSALQDAGGLLLAKTNTFSPPDGYLAAALDAIFGGTTYRTHVMNYFYGPLAAGTYNRNGAGTLYNTAGYVNLIRTSRASQGIPNLAAWDVGMGLVGAAAAGADPSAWISGTKAEIDELDGSAYYDVIGLAGAVYGLAYVGEDFDPTAGEHAAASSLADLGAILASYQLSTGGFTWNSENMAAGSDETTQETAYAILALDKLNRTSYLGDILDAADFLLDIQLANGGWPGYVGGGENNEVTAEALWGVSVAYGGPQAEVWVCPSGDCGHPGAYYHTIQSGVIGAADGGIVHVLAGTYTGGVYINKALTLLAEGGAVIHHGSSAIIIDADDVTIDGFIVDGTGCGGGEPGIFVVTGADRTWLRNNEVKNWCESGIKFAGSHTDVKIVDNYIHDNSGDGLTFPDAAPTGATVQVYGNAFRNNNGAGVSVGSGSLDAEYNEWGSIDGPAGAGGDGVSGDVDFTPWVFGALDVCPSSASVREGEQVTLDVKMDVHHLFGVQFDLTFDKTKLQLAELPTIGSFKTSTPGAVCTLNSLANANAEGKVKFNCNRADGDAEFDAVDSVILTLKFNALEIGSSPAVSAIDILDGTVKLGAKGGVNIFVDSVVDGQVSILGTTSISGVVDLQGRDNDSGAVVNVPPGTLYVGGTDTTDAWGRYGINNITDGSYLVAIEMARYLDAAATVGISGETLVLNPVKLLGGDVDDNDVIEINDASAIGGAFGTVPGDTYWNASADINNDGVINILDLVLMGGNYGLTSPVAWTP